MVDIFALRVGMALIRSRGNYNQWRGRGAGFPESAAKKFQCACYPHHDAGRPEVADRCGSATVCSAFSRPFAAPNPHPALMFECTFRRTSLIERKIKQPHFLFLRRHAASRRWRTGNRYQLHRESAISYGLNRRLCVKSVSCAIDG